MWMYNAMIAKNRKNKITKYQGIKKSFVHRIISYVVGMIVSLIIIFYRIHSYPSHHIYANTIVHIISQVSKLTNFFFIINLTFHYSAKFHVQTVLYRCLSAWTSTSCFRRCFHSLATLICILKFNMDLY